MLENTWRTKWGYKKKLINIDKRKRSCHAVVKFDKDDTSWLVMSCISSHADHLRGCFSTRLEGAKHPMSRRGGNCVLHVQERAHFNKENRSNIRLDVSWCRYINAYVGCRGTSVRLGPDAFSPSSLFPRARWISAMINLPCGSSRTRRCLGMSGRGENVLADVLHFRRFRVREATDRTPKIFRPARPSLVRSRRTLSLTPSFSLRSVRKEVVARRGCAMWKQERVRGFIDPRDRAG